MNQSHNRPLPEDKSRHHMFSLSAFGDEIDDDLSEQLHVLNQLDIHRLDLRGVWGKNVLHLSDEEVYRVYRLCEDQGAAVSCIGSPIGKSPLVEPIEQEMQNLQRIFAIAQCLVTQRIRIFSFYPPDTSSNAHYDQHLPEVIDRLGKLTEMAQREDVTLLLENETQIVGDTIARCHAILSAIDSPHLQFLWDPANFVMVGEQRATERGWPLLGARTGYVHIKDAQLNPKRVTPAGQGDGQVAELLAHLREDGRDIRLALEPHLAIAAQNYGYSGPEGMEVATQAVRKVLHEIGGLEWRF